MPGDPNLYLSEARFRRELLKWQMQKPLHPAMQEVVSDMANAIKKNRDEWIMEQLIESMGISKEFLV